MTPPLAPMSCRKGLMWRLVLLTLALLVPYAQAETARPKLIGSIAGNSAPLHTETLPVPGGSVTVGFYEWPLRVDQLSLISVQGSLPPAQTSVQLEPAPQTNALPARALSEPDGAMSDLSWHELTPSVQGAWVLEVRLKPVGEVATTPATSSVMPSTALTVVARLPTVVEGPPELPRWAAWMIAGFPLLMLALFVRKLGEAVTRTRGDESPWWDAVASSYGAYAAAREDTGPPAGGSQP